jgi:hypothetical protein
MNVLILTPDRVGSTLLQRLITIHMQSHDFGKPVINLHELTNGLVSYENSKFNRMVLGKRQEVWGYHQSLEQIVDLLESVDHYKTARLAHYHIRNRQDPIEQQLPFYKYLNENFFIISARRNNLLEHALSWCIFTVSKKLNVYGHKEKIDTFSEIYKNQIHVDQQVFVNYLNSYVSYIKWTEDHFNINSCFDYEKDLADIETYINNLNLFGNDKKNNFWQNIFGMPWKDWNMCHYLLSDLSTGGQNASTLLTQHLPWVDSKSVENLPTLVNEIGSAVKLADQQFIKENINQYLETDKNIQHMVQDGILASSVPIKLQTMIEKCHLIKNFEQCLETYNRWVDQTKFGVQVTQQQILDHSVDELAQWHSSKVAGLLSTTKSNQLN